MDNRDKKVAAIRAALDRPLVLVGMMGAGKTKLGRMLADALGLAFYDSDDEIEKAAGMDIPTIFDRFGEPYFRDGERRVIARLLENPPCVIATGGGALMNPDTARDVAVKGLSVWVRAALPVMLERTARSDRRPLLRNGDPETILKSLMEKRYPLYERADLRVHSHDGPPEQILAEALDSLYDRLT